MYLRNKMSDWLKTGCTAIRIISSYFPHCNTLPATGSERAISTDLQLILFVTNVLDLKRVLMHIRRGSVGNTPISAVSEVDVIFKLWVFLLNSMVEVHVSWTLQTLLCASHKNITLRKKSLQFNNILHIYNHLEIIYRRNIFSSWLDTSLSYIMLPIPSQCTRQVQPFFQFFPAVVLYCCVEKHHGIFDEISAHHQDNLYPDIAARNEYKIVKSLRNTVVISLKIKSIFCYQKHETCWTIVLLTMNSKTERIARYCYRKMLICDDCSVYTADFVLPLNWLIITLTRKFCRIRPPVYQVNSPQTS